MQMNEMNFRLGRGQKREQNFRFDKQSAPTFPRFPVQSRVWPSLVQTDHYSTIIRKSHQHGAPLHVIFSA
jgi:hypothetical protein